MKLTKSQLKQIIEEETNTALNEAAEGRPPTQQGSQFAPTASEEAKKVNAQAGISLVTNPEHWARMGIHTGEELAKELLASSYSDLFKSIHGIRPRFMNFKAMSVEEIQAALELLDDYEDHLGREEPQEEYDEFYTKMPEEEPEDIYDEPKQSGMGRRLKEIKK